MSDSRLTAPKGLSADIIAATANAFDVGADASEWHKREYGTPRIAAALLLHKYAKLDFDAIAQPFGITREGAMQDVYRAQQLFQTVKPFGEAVAAITIDVLALKLDGMEPPDLSAIRTMPLV